MATPTLWGLSISPWTERTRWALDHHQIHYRYRETFYRIDIRGVGAAPGRVVIRVAVDGTEIDGAGREGAGRGRFGLVDDRQAHHVEVDLG